MADVFDNVVIAIVKSGYHVRCLRKRIGKGCLILVVIGLGRWVEVGRCDEEVRDDGLFGDDDGVIRKPPAPYGDQVFPGLDKVSQIVRSIPDHHIASGLLWLSEKKGLHP